MQRFTLESESKKNRKFSKCQIFPDILVFRGNDEKTTFTPKNFGVTPPLGVGLLVTKHSDVERKGREHAAPRRLP